MNVVDIITKKRNGQVLSNLEIETIVNGYTTDKIPDYQMAAWLMAVYFQGMTIEETAALTMIMAKSGKMVDLSSVPGIKVDKHSTGGVADTTTLVLAPLVAATGVPVAKMSGRGLGFTGGTIDKLEAITGFKTTLSENEFISILQKHNLALTGQGHDIAPADGKIYGLRDVTGTVESIPLIASSIMSKKIAAGADKILLDVKVGSGAFMKSIDDAKKLAQTMVHIGESVNRETRVILSNMDEPLGQAVGNSLEIEEAMDILDGKGEAALREVCLILASNMIHMAGIVANVDEGYKKLNTLLDNKTALNKFKEFITAQGGNAEIVTNRSLLPDAKYKLTVTSNTSGFIQKIIASQIGYSAMKLGAGREYKNQPIDLSAGIMLKCRVGDQVEKDQPLAIMYTNDESKLEEVKQLITAAITIGPESVPRTKLILGYIDKHGFKNI